MPLTPDERSLADLIGAAFSFNESAAPPPDLEGKDWPLMVETATSHGIAPLAYAALKKSDLLKVAPRSAIETLRLNYLRASVANRLAFQDLSYWVDRFRHENIPVIVLKGGALAVTVYDDIALRPMGDLDLLIRPESVARAREVLIEEGYAEGYASLTGMAGRSAARFSVAQSFQRMGKRPSQIDIHWHAFTTPYYFERIPVEWFWERTTGFQAGHARALTFSPEAQLLHLSAHCMLHGYRRLIWSYDIARLIRRCAGQIDWDEIVRASETFGLSQLLSKSLLEVREHWGVRVPAPVYERLGAAHTPLKGRVVFGASEAVSGGPLELINGLGLIGARRKMAYWKSIVFPSASYMRGRFQIRNRAFVLPWYLWRAGRAVFLMSRAGLSISREAILSRLFRRAT
ncbi:MAG TPA: nucleotidyltransferase family protein [Blastocatellia bacterium]|nr:nucleotidyltransferase family protein [Blastocatellia bacterium]